MSDTRSRADKLAAMASASESPHEAATAAEMLAGMRGTLAEQQEAAAANYAARVRIAERRAPHRTAVMRLCEIPDCGRKHFIHGLCNVHWERANRAPAPPDISRVKCGAETFDGTERRRCTRPASQVRDGLLVCKQHERVEIVYWVGRGSRLRTSLTERSVPQITARRRIPEGWHLFDHDGVAATRVEDLPVTPPFVRSRHPGDPPPSVREVFPA